MSLYSSQLRSVSSHLKAFATVDPNNLNAAKDKGYNLVNGEWVEPSQYINMIDPLTGKDMIKIPDTQIHETDPFIESLKACPKSGLHNPYKNKERYLMLSEVCRKTVECMHDPEVFDFFVKCV